jgi:hypothetical protein
MLETTAAVARPRLGSRVASSSDRWILRRLKAPSRPGICPSRTESSRFRLTNVATLIASRRSETPPPFVSPMSLLRIRRSQRFYAKSLCAADEPDKTSQICDAFRRETVRRHDFTGTFTRAGDGARSWLTGFSASCSGGVCWCSALWLGLQGNPVQIRDCPAAVSENETHGALAFWLGSVGLGSRPRPKCSRSPKTCQHTSA